MPEVMYAEQTDFLTGRTERYVRITAGGIAIGRHHPATNATFQLVRSRWGYDVIWRGQLVAFTCPLLKLSGPPRRIQKAGHRHHGRELRWTDGVLIRLGRRMVCLIRP